MITVKFFTQGLPGFEVSGHAGYAEAGQDIVCAAVSSAVGLCECTITDVMGAEATIKVNERDASVYLRLSKENEKASDIISGLMLYLVSLRDEYSEYIEVLEV